MVASWRLYRFLMACVVLVGCGLVVACSDVLGPPAESGHIERTTDVAADSEQSAPDALGEADLLAPDVAGGDRPPRPSVHEPYRQTWYGGAVMYQIFVRSFQDSDGDGIGDLKGITQRLDYLQSGKAGSQDDLKVAGIWLTPIFRSGSYHGYDTLDYQAIDPAYGTLDDFQQLLSAAHTRGLKVILDLVLNHTSRAHPWFKDASSGPSSAKRDWYVWRQDNPNWGHPFAPGSSPWVSLGGFFYYAIFSPGMPDLNLQHPPVVEALQEAMGYWLGQGVDGFRLDAVRYLIAPDEAGQADSPETHKLLKALVANVRKTHPKALIVGEAWTTTPAVARYFGDGDELDLCFQFDLVDAIDRALQTGRASLLRTPLADALRHLQEPAFYAPILGNHDHKRLMSRLLHDTSAAKLAATFLLTLPGTPFVYYGEEIGIGNANNEGDISKRAPMQWDDSPKAGFSTGIPWARLFGKQEQVSVAIQTKSPDSLLARYRQLIRLRQQSNALRHGPLQLIELQGEKTTAGLAYLRKDGDERVLVVLNVAETQTLDASIAVDALGGEDKAPTAWESLLDGASLAVKRNAKAELVLPQVPAHGTLLLRLK